MIRVKGMEALIAKLEKGIDFKEAQEVVKMNGAELDKEMNRNAKFKGHYRGKKFIKPTGATKRSIRLTMSEGGLRASVMPTTEYAPYLEYGTRFMSAQPFVKVSYQKQKEKFLADLKRLMK